MIFNKDEDPDVTLVSLSVALRVLEAFQLHMIDGIENLLIPDGPNPVTPSHNSFCVVNYTLLGRRRRSSPFE